MPPHAPTGQEIHLDSEGRFYDLADDSGAKTISRETPLQAIEPTFDRQITNHREQWEPLEKAIGFHGADEFQYYGNQGDIRRYGREVEERKELIGVDNKGRFYEFDANDQPVRVSREDALKTVDQPTHFYTPVEATPTHKDWSRLEQAVGRENAVDFTFRGETTGIQSYQHDHTGNHVRLDSAGQFHNAEHQPIARDAALSHALPPQGIEIAQASPAAQEPVRFEGLSREQSISM